MTVHIREAVPTDFTAIQPIDSESQEKHAHALQHIFQQGVYGLPQDYYLSLLAGDNSVVYVAELNHNIVGYVIAEYKELAYLDALIPRKLAFISDIAVREAHQGQGIGYALFQTCVNWARTKGANSLDLMVWEFNKDAIAFYERQGMQSLNRTMSLEL
ncbi:MAG: GNAT family N-acetyltransferase [Ktedonobacteraceae bacterium]